MYCRVFVKREGGREGGREARKGGEGVRAGRQG